MLPRGWESNVGRTTSEILVGNLSDPQRPTDRQIYYLIDRCAEYDLTAHDLVRFGVELGRLHPQHADTIDNNQSEDEHSLLYQLSRREIGGLFEIVHAWQSTVERNTEQTRFNFHEGMDTPSPIGEGEVYTFPCPECGEEYGGVHIAAVRIAPHGARMRPSAQIALSCEQGCVTTLVIGNHKGVGYAFWQRDVDWADAAFSEYGGRRYHYEDQFNPPILPIIVPNIDAPILDVGKQSNSEAE